MKIVSLIQNQHERQMVRVALATFFEEVSVPGSPESALNFLRPGNAPDIILVDESFDNQHNTGASISTLEFLKRINKIYADPPFIALINNAQDNPDEEMENIFDRQQTYFENGADFFLRRPVSTDSFNLHLSSIAATVKNPPAWKKAVNQAREYFRAKDFSKSVAIIHGVLENIDAEKDHIALMHAKCLLNIGGERVHKSDTLLDDLEKIYPGSVQVQENILDCQAHMGNKAKAFDAAVRMFRLSPDRTHFLKMLDYSLGEAEKTKSRQPLFDLCDRLVQLNVSGADSFLTETLSNLAQNVENLAELDALLDLLVDLPESTSRLGREMGYLFEQFNPQFNDNHVELRARFLKTVLTANPGHLKALENYVTRHVEQEDPEDMETYLDRAKEAEALGREYFLARAVFSLNEKRFRDASEAIRSGLTLNEEDEGFLNLKEEWRKKYEDSESE